MGLIIVPWLSANVLEFTPVDERGCFLGLWGGERLLIVVCAYVPNSSSEYLHFLNSLEKELESAPTRDSIVLLGDSNAHMGNDSKT